MNTTAMVSIEDALRVVPCPRCDGLGEWDEGPYGGWSEPNYRQVICPECNGSGRALIETEPRTIDDIEEEDAQR